MPVVNSGKNVEKLSRRERTGIIANEDERATGNIVPQELFHWV